MITVTNGIELISDDLLDNVSGGQDGGAPQGTQTTTKTTTTSGWKASGEIGASVGPVKAGGKGEYSKSETVETTTSNQCYCPAPWKGVPWR
jgi:hypothetical protein